MKQPIVFAILVVLIGSFESASAAYGNVRITASCLNMRTKATSRSGKISCVPQGRTLVSTGRRQGNWIQVNNNGRTGWVSSRFATPVRSAPPVQPQQVEMPVRKPQVPNVATQSYGVDMTDTPSNYKDSGKVGGSSLKRDPVASSGRCLLDVVQTDEQAKEVLADYRVYALGASDKERLALAKTLFQLTAYNGNVFTPLAGTKITFDSKDGVSRYKGGDHVQMARKSHNCNSAHFAHEMGHKLGHESFGGGTFYSAYHAAAGTSCQPTGYSKASANENFAEVFAAFVTRPELLSQGSSGCKKAFAFFSEKVFKASGTMASCDPQKKQTLMASLDTRGSSATHGLVASRGPVEHNVQALTAQ